MFLFWLIFSLFSLSSPLSAQEEETYESEVFVEDLYEEDFYEEEDFEPIFNFNEERTEDYTLYYYNENLDSYRGLNVQAQIGYRIPSYSPIEAGYEISITFSGNEATENILSSLGNQATIQVYSPLTGLLRFRLILNKEIEDQEFIEELYDEEGFLIEEDYFSSYSVTYRIKEANYLFFNRLLNELKGQRDSMILLYDENSQENIRVNLGLDVPSLIEFSESIKKLN